MAGDIPSPANIKNGPQRRTLRLWWRIFSQKMHHQNAFFFSDLSENVIPLASLLSFWLLSTLHFQFRSLKTWNSMKKIQKNIITPFSVFPIGCSEMDSANSSPAQKLPLQWTDRTKPGINLKNTQKI